MTEVFLHGFGSTAALFRREWTTPADPAGRVFLDGFEPEPLSGNRRWFPFSAVDVRLTESLAACGARLEADIADLVAARPGTPIGLYGHSQGGMLALALACRGRLPIAMVHAFAAYLPDSEIPPPPPRPINPVIFIHSSRRDPYVRRAQVERTIARLKAARVGDVRDLVADDLPHDFSADWLRPSLFSEVPA